VRQQEKAAIRPLGLAWVSTSTLLPSLATLNTRPRAQGDSVANLSGGHTAAPGNLALVREEASTG